VKSAIESASTYASETAEKASEFADTAAETVNETYGQAKEVIGDAAKAVGVATGAGYNSGYAPRERRPERQASGGRDSNSGMDRRGGYGGDRAERSFAVPERQITPSNGIYIGNLLFDVTAADLEREFSSFGEIKSSIIASDARGLSKGYVQTAPYCQFSSAFFLLFFSDCNLLICLLCRFGYIEFETIEQAEAAIAAKHQTVLEGRRLVVNYMNKTTRAPRGENPPSKTLFIGNLAFEMSDADLNKLFRDIRNVIDVRVAIDRRTGQPRGFAHADFTDVDSAIKGKEALMGKAVYGRELRVDFSAGSRSARGDGSEPGNRRDRF
jgi:nucleolin